MRSSLRNRLLVTFIALVLVAGGGTLFAIERTLADDLTTSLASRMTEQARAVARWVSNARHLDRLAPRLAAVTGARLTIIGADGLVLGDSLEPGSVGRPIGNAWEVSRARRGEVGHAIRHLGTDERLQFLVAVPVAPDERTRVAGSGVPDGLAGGAGVLPRGIDERTRVAGGGVPDGSAGGAGVLPRGIDERNVDGGDADGAGVAGGLTVRLAVPLDDVLATRARMRNRLLVGAAFGFAGCLVLSWIFIRTITRPLQAMTRTAEQLARGDYQAPLPIDSGGELGVLARAMNRMTGEVKARVGELTDQRDLLSVVVGGLVEGVVVVGRDRKLALVNDAARPLIGGGGELGDRLSPLVTRALAGEPADDELELVGRTVRASARPLGDAGAIVVLYDVTRLRALEAVRREFLSNAAHELRTPVTAISGYAETLLAGGVDPATSSEFLRTIHRNAQRIAALVADLLVLDSLESRAAIVGARVPIALADVVGDAARTARGVTPGAEIEVDVAGDLSVLGNREGLDHIVQNLIDNAIKHGATTPVTVRAERIADRVQLAVRDLGPGIPDGHEDRVFERFYRLDAGRGRNAGSGLGLAIVKRQIEAIGGRVWVENARPGARFVVELDAA